jgi:signal-transduction protein with cAMP-binding, CBS, and nucleotidyltransferase domain
MPQRLREVMTEGAETISPDASVKEAAVKMEVLNIGPLVVLRWGPHPRHRHRSGHHGARRGVGKDPNTTAVATS